MMFTRVNHTEDVDFNYLFVIVSTVSLCWNRSTLLTLLLILPCEGIVQKMPEQETKNSCPLQNERTRDDSVLDMQDQHQQIKQSNKNQNVMSTWANCTRDITV